MRLIDADAVIEMMKLQAGCESCDNYNGVRCRACPWDDAMSLVDDYADNNSADVAPVRHGKWIFDDFDGDGLDYECSLCGKYQRRRSRFCPKCGAKME